MSSKQQPRGNELPDIEVLGEFDHGILDPVLSPNTMNNGGSSSSLTYVKDAVLKVEGKVEAVAQHTLQKVENALVVVEHAVENAFEEMKEHGVEDTSFGDDLTGVDTGVWVAIAEDYQH